MKSFLLNSDKTPILKWSRVPDGIFFEGPLPDGYSLAVAPHQPYIILDVDRHGGVDGFENIPENIKVELEQSYSYPTKNNGVHYWLLYTGDKTLINKSSGLGVDLRIGANKETGNAGGFVVYYEAQKGKDIRDHTHLIKETSKELNMFLESLFA